MSSRKPIVLPSAAKRLVVNHSPKKSMCTDHDYPCIPMRPLSDEATVEILNFLQVFMTDFENSHGNQIRRYYDERSRHNIIQHYPSEPTDDPPF